MVTKNAALMQALFCKKALKINDLYMYGMFRCELYEYWCSVVGSFAGYRLDGFRKKRKLPWTGITNWGTSSEKKQRRGAQKKTDGLSSAIYRTKSARRGFRILRRIRCLIEPVALVRFALATSFSTR